MFATVLDYGFRVCTVGYIEANLEHQKSYVIWKVYNVKNVTYPQTKFIVALSWWSIYDLGSKGGKLETHRRQCCVLEQEALFSCLVLVEPRKTSQHERRMLTVP